MARNVCAPYIFGAFLWLIRLAAHGWFGLRGNKKPKKSSLLGMATLFYYEISAMQRWVKVWNRNKILLKRKDENFEEVDVVRGSINLLPADKIQLWKSFYLSVAYREHTHMPVLVQPK